MLVMIMVMIMIIRMVVIGMVEVGGGVQEEGRRVERQ
jgi:hypothetical protein